MSFAASILVLSEDGGHRVVRAFVRQVLRFVDPDHRPAGVDLEPEDEGAQEAIQGNLYKGRTGEGHHKRVTIARTVATKILSPTGYVFVHVDADRLWKKRRRDPSDNLRRFEEIRVAVAQHVEGVLARKIQDSRQRAAAKAAALSRLCVLSPYYSIESWLFQNTAAAKALCHKHHRGRDVQKFEAWERDRTLLDDVDQPKKATCLGAGKNLELATAPYPAQAVYEAGRSFTESMDRVRACTPLAAALMSTHAPR